MKDEESNEKIEKVEENIQEEIVEEKIEQAQKEETDIVETDENLEQAEKDETGTVEIDENPKQVEKEKTDIEETDVKTKQVEKDENKVEKNEDGKVYKQVNVKKTKKISTPVFILIIVVLVIILMLFSTVFALANLGNDKILDGVSIKGVSLVGLTKEDAKLEIQDVIENEFQKAVVLKYNQYETEIAPKQIEASYDIDKAINEAYLVGRSGNIIKNNFEILCTMLFGKEISLDFYYNDNSLTQICEDISKKLPGAIKDNSYYIEGNNLIVTKGTAGIAIKTEECKKLIVNQIKNVDGAYVTIPVEDKVPSPLNIDEIYQEVKKEPKDAYYTENPFTIHPHENGVDFAISLGDARKLLEEDKEQYEIPLEFKEPEFTTDQIGTEAFPDLITQFSTRYDASNYNRTTNLKLASDKINGVILMPGEEFSYNKVVGERTIAAGYKDAAIYSGGQVVDGLGGGICQISSTLYNAAVQANLEITQRSNHQFKTSYVDAGKDATVVYGAIDFKFRNTRQYPIKIESTVKNGVAEMKIYGVKEDVEYDIKIETETLEVIPYSTKYIEDSSLESGKEELRQNGTPGYKTIAYKVCRLNGGVVSKTVLSNDTYDAMTKIIARGTKNSKPVKSTQPSKNNTNSSSRNTTTNTSSSGKNTITNKVN